MEIKKRILLVCPRFYFYHQLIAERLCEKKYEVDFVEERYYGIIYLLLKAFGNRIFTYFSTRRYLKFLHYHPYSYDLLFVIKGETFPIEVIKILKSRNPHLYSVLYQWDSVRNFNYLHLIPFFDKTMSFDKSDSEKFNIGYYLLFYTEDVFAIRNKVVPKKYDLLLVSTYLPERIDYIRDLIEFSKKNNLRFYYYLYITRYQHLRLLFKQRVSGLQIHHKPMSKEQLVKLYAMSNVIVDVSNKNQTGLSMRVIEMLGAGKKLLTTNQNLPICIDIQSEQYRLFTRVEDIDLNFVRNSDNISFNEYRNLFINNWVDYIIEHEDKSI